MKKIKLRVKAVDAGVEVKAIITHPMHTGRVKDKESGELIPAHFIEDVNFTANDKAILTCNWGGSISKNPYTSFTYPGKSGDVVKLSWKDNKGETGEAEATVK